MGGPSNYEILTADEIENYFPTHAIKLLRDEIQLRVNIKPSIRQFNITLWQDGLSGSRTKRWNPHEYTLLSFPGIKIKVSIFLKIAIHYII